MGGHDSWPGSTGPTTVQAMPGVDNRWAEGRRILGRKRNLRMLVQLPCLHGRPQDVGRGPMQHRQRYALSFTRESRPRRQWLWFTRDCRLALKDVVTSIGPFNFWMAKCILWDFLFLFFSFLCFIINLKPWTPWDNPSKLWDPWVIIKCTQILVWVQTHENLLYILTIL